ncbi:MAG: DNA-3-methyladenine glycosylase I [Candidatus Adiutrix sp.]
MSEKNRCAWANTPLYIEYHDKEWGRPLHDEGKLFEMLNLEGAQAGLSWITVLKKRNAYRLAFDGFDPHKISLYDDLKVSELMANEGIVRNRLKIKAVINNAQAYLKLVETHESLDKFLWNYVDNKPIVNHFKNIEDLPAVTPLSMEISKNLKKMGFKFVGPTIIYALMQAIGMVNDHCTTCFVYGELNH